MMLDFCFLEVIVANKMRRATSYERSKDRYMCIVRQNERDMLWLDESEYKQML